MMIGHLLINRAKRYDAESTVTVLEKYKFHGRSGYWINIDTGMPMMLDSCPLKCGTKKEDIETGEDQKGE